MDEYEKNTGGRHKILKSIGMIVGATGIAVGAYLLGTTKRAAYTLGGIALIVSAPALVRVANSCVNNHADIKKTEIIYEWKKDSLDIERRKNAPKDTVNITHLLTERDKVYQSRESENSKKYAAQLKEKEAQYDVSVKALTEKTSKLEKTVEDLKNSQVAVVSADYSPNHSSNKSSNSSTITPNMNYSPNNSINLERIASTHEVTENSIASGNYAPAYYLIDADKSDGEINVYGVSSDGSRNQLGISSKASFAMNGGPANGSYVLTNKGTRSGELYPGFLEMSNPVGISGAGEYNQHLDEIQQGAYKNRTGIRVPNEVETSLAKLVDKKRTVIIVHD